MTSLKPIMKSAVFSAPDVTSVTLRYRTINVTSRDKKLLTPLRKVRLSLRLRRFFLPNSLISTVLCASRVPNFNLTAGKMEKIEQNFIYTPRYSRALNASFHVEAFFSK